MRNLLAILFCFLFSVSSVDGLMAQPTPPDNKCDSLDFLNVTLSHYEGTTSLIFVFKNNSEQSITDISMKLEPTEMSGLILLSDETTHPNVFPGQTFSVFFFLENNLSELELDLDIAGEIITLPKENEFKCEIEYNKTFVNPVLDVDENIFSNIQLYPNPAKDHIVISNSSASGIYKLYDLRGRAIDVEADYNGKDWILKWQGLTEGLYILKEKESHSYQKIWIK